MAQLRHLALRCRDMELSRRFYEQVIGWRFVAYREARDGMDLTDGVNNVTLIQQPAEQERTQLDEGKEFIHFGVIVDDLDAVWNRLREWGAVLSKENVKLRNPIEPWENPPMSFKVLDPDGNVVDITGNRCEWRGVTLNDGFATAGAKSPSSVGESAAS